MEKIILNPLISKDFISKLNDYDIYKEIIALDDNSDYKLDKNKRRLIKNDKFIELTEKEIKLFLAERYGEYILFRPMIDYKNLFLWAFPFVLLAISLFFIVFRVKKNKV